MSIATKRIAAATTRYATLADASATGHPRSTRANTSAYAQPPTTLAIEPRAASAAKRPPWSIARKSETGAELNGNAMSHPAID
ncbi:MAG TPA: hypothetical protein VI814_14875 [Candidatus Limnocylindria bacterium]